MKKFIPVLLLLITSALFAQQNVQQIYIAAWNLENLFDNVDDPDKNDEEWLAEGPKQWDDVKINLKIKNLAKVIKYMNDLEGPDMLGVEEVEHRALLDTLIARYFCDRNYGVAYEETLDKRGIDCGLIYDKDKFEFAGTVPHEVELASKYPTRYVLQVNLKDKFTGDNLYVFVNHWPSRRGGEEKSRPNRVKAAEVLMEAISKLPDEDPFIFIMGDFNDEPSNESIKSIVGAVSYDCKNSVKNSDSNFLNLAYPLFDEGHGTYLYRGDWNMLDQIIVSQAVVKDNLINYICNSFEIIKPEIMVTKSGPYKDAAIPTWGGRKYLAGFSDHYPVGAKFILRKK